MEKADFPEPEYADFINECAKHCHCCPECNSDIPCAGTMSGGLCDQMCSCDDRITYSWVENPKYDNATYEMPTAEEFSKGN